MIELRDLPKSHFARARLAACASLQEIVLTPGGHPNPATDMTFAGEFKKAIETESKKSAASSFGTSWYKTHAAITEGIRYQEETRLDLIRRLESSLRNRPD